MRPIYILSIVVLSVLTTIFIYEDVRMNSQSYADSQKVGQVDVTFDSYEHEYDRFPNKDDHTMFQTDQEIPKTPFGNTELIDVTEEDYLAKNVHPLEQTASY